MSATHRLNALLTIQRRRVDQALAELRARNEQLQKAELERAAEQDRWEATQTRRKREITRQAELVRNHAAQSLAAAELTLSGQRIEWWRLRAEEQKKALDAADAALTQAQADAAQARRRFQQADARHTGLLKLVNERQRTLLLERVRMEEYDSDDGRACEGKS